MPDIKNLVVSCEKLLANLEKDFPNLTKQATFGGWTITAAGIGYGLNKVAEKAKLHDPRAEKHDVTYHR